MAVIEITLLVLGAIIFVASFVLPEQKKEASGEQQKFSEDEVKKIIEKEMEHVRDRVDEVIDETIDYTMDKTERSLSKISNEKIMAVNEYSDTVLEEINKNHKEVMFLYDMLNDKQTELNNIVRKAEATKDETVTAVNEAASIATQRAEEVRRESTAWESASAQEAQPEVAEPSVTVERIAESFDKPHPEPIFHKLAEGVDIPVLDRAGGVTVEDVLAGAGVKKTTARKTTTQKVSAEKTPAAKPKADKVTSPKPAKSVISKPEGKNNNRKILELHREGKSNVDIAKELGLGLGEVKLVLDLFEGA